MLPSSHGSYGLSVAWIALYLELLFAPQPGSLGLALSSVLLVYGLRLSLYLYLRDICYWREPITDISLHRLYRVLLAFFISMLYACMSMPLLSVLRVKGTSRLAWVGIYFAWAGAVVEACADAHKHIAKRGKPQRTFQGPTRGMYAIVRHPNYFGEIVFWCGVWLAGVPSAFRSDNPEGRICSTLGICLLVWIMEGATERLERKQNEVYRMQKKYKLWRNRVTSPLYPFSARCTVHH